MQVVRRTGLTIALSAVVPLLIFATLQVAANFRQLRDGADLEALNRTRAVTARIDAAIMADQGALSVLGSSQPLMLGDVRGALVRARDVGRERARWANVILTDVASGLEVWSTSGDRPERSQMRPPVAEYLDSGLAAAVGGMDRAEPDCGCVSLHEPVERLGQLLYVLTVQRTVEDFQEIMMNAIEGAEVAGVVDREGLFIARSLDYRARLGTPATEYVRNAITAGGEGFYTGVTYEGLRNRTAYSTSALTGWSAHIAVPAVRFNLLSTGSVGFTVVAALISLAFATGIALIGIRELREQRLAERARVQSQKLEAIGQLAGGLAHDFNNLLAIMMACLKQLKRIVDEPKAVEVIDHGLAAADRGAKLASELLSFARTKPLETTCVDLAETVEGVRDLLAKSLGAGIKLAVDLNADAQHAQTNASQFELALLNLAVNARDAMPEGGVFTIRSRLARDQKMVELTVEDTGQGMPPHVAARAVEPFFTTKPEGKGTGLGLAQVNALAADSGGSLEIVSSPGAGTQVVLRLMSCPPAHDVVRTD